MPSSRPGRSSKGKHSTADSYNLPPMQSKSPRDGSVVHGDSAGSKAITASTWPPTSFWFTVNELPINDDTQNGGIPPQSNDDHYWLPPLNSAGFGVQRHGDLYKWDEGRVTKARGYHRVEGYWSSQTHVRLVAYDTTTMFYCNQFTLFRSASGDASSRHVGSDNTNAPGRWWALQFYHSDSLTRVGIPGLEHHLAGSGPWVADLGLDRYLGDETRVEGGLGGNLTMIIALIAFSCRANRLDTVLREAWNNRLWRGHNYSHGRSDERGVVVTVYLDPDNPQGSTEEILRRLEWEGERLL